MPETTTKITFKRHNSTGSVIIYGKIEKLYLLQKDLYHKSCETINYLTDHDKTSFLHDIKTTLQTIIKNFVILLEKETNKLKWALPLPGIIPNYLFKFAYLKTLLQNTVFNNQPLVIYTNPELEELLEKNISRSEQIHRDLLILRTIQDLFAFKISEVTREYTTELIELFSPLILLINQLREIDLSLENNSDKTNFEDTSFFKQQKSIITGLLKLISSSAVTKHKSKANFLKLLNASINLTFNNLNSMLDDITQCLKQYPTRKKPRLKP